MQETDKHVTYNGIDAHIKIPARPQGLAFIAPGALVSTQSSLITTAQSAFEDLGYATVVADIGPSELNMDDPVNVHGNFSKNLQGVIDGYFEDEENDYVPNTFELAGHSMGGAAVLTIASENPVSAITVFDPTPVQEDVLSQVNAPVTIMVSQVRSFKASGHRALERLGGEERGHNIHELNTSAERHSGHMFEGAEHEITHIIQNRPQGGTSPNPSTPDTLDL